MKRKIRKEKKEERKRTVKKIREQGGMSCKLVLDLFERKEEGSKVE